MKIKILNLIGFIITISSNLLSYLHQNIILTLIGLIGTTYFTLYLLGFLTLVLNRFDKPTKKYMYQLYNQWLFHESFSRLKLVDILDDHIYIQLATFQKLNLNEAQMTLQYEFNLPVDQYDNFKTLFAKKTVPKDFIEDYLKHHGPNNVFGFITKVNSNFYPDFTPNKRDIEQLSRSCVDCDAIITAYFKHLS